MSADLVGGRLGKYEIQAEIGRGGMGAVYLGYDPLLDRRVAIKVLAPHLVWEPGFVERFLREARAAARLKHPNVVTIYDVGQEGNHYYFVMEFIEGRTLAQVIKQRGALSPAEVTAVLRPLADALDQAHRQGLVHRDIKPGNIMVGPAGQVMLTDFGIARAAQEVGLTTTGTLVGTPEYMSPEQARGEVVDARTDQYSLGIVAYEMLSGKVPFAGTTPHGVLYRQIHEPLPPIRQVRPDLPPEAQVVLQQALAKEPDHRYPTVSAFAQALDQALVGGAAETAAEMPTLAVGQAREAVAVPTTTPPPRQPAAAARPATPATVPEIAPTVGPVTARRRSGALWVLVALAALVAAGVLVGVILLLGRGGEGVQATSTPTAAVQAQVREATPAPRSTRPEPGQPVEPSKPGQPFECPDRAGCVDVAPGQPIRIGYLLATRGESSAVGLDSQRGVELALADRPDVLGHPLELVGEDTGCDPDSAVAGAERLAGDPGLVAVVGLNCTNEALAAAPILCERNLPVVSPSATGPLLTTEDRPAGLWCFLRTAYNDTALSQGAARFAREVLRVDRAATIQDDNPYSGGLQVVFAETFSKLGGTIVAQEVVGPEGAEPPVDRIAGTGAQFIYLPVILDTGAAIVIHARQLPELQSVSLLGTDGLFTPELFQRAGEAALGFLWAQAEPPSSPRHGELEARYAERYGEPPLTRFYANAYDAAMMILEAIERAAIQDGDGTLHIPRGGLNEHLHATQNFPGVTGPLNCRPSGDCAEARIVIYEAMNTDPGLWNPGPDGNPRIIWP